MRVVLSLRELDLFEQGGLPAMAPTRRLAAILAADVAGYSRLMGADEEGTHARLRAHLRELVDPKIEEHRGRIVKNTGDGLLAEFPSAVDAVRCAVEVQRGMVDREPDLPDEPGCSSFARTGPSRYTCARTGVAPQLRQPEGPAHGKFRLYPSNQYPVDPAAQESG